MTALKFRAFKNGKMYPVHTLDFNDDGTVSGYCHLKSRCIDLEGAVFEQWNGKKWEVVYEPIIEEVKN